MKLAKQKTTVFYSDELKHNISNYFTFSIKQLYRSIKPLDAKNGKIPPICSKCCNQLTSNPCRVCLTQNDLPQYQKQKKEEQDKKKKVKKLMGLQSSQQIDEEVKQKNEEQNKKQKIPENYVLKKEMPENSKQSKQNRQCVILCVDLSGSMERTYISKYKKVNEESVKRILGVKNYQDLKKKLGKELVVNKCDDIKRMLDLGDTIKDIASIFETMQFQTYEDPKQEYISRKQLIEAAVSKYLEMLRQRSPKTMLTIVYFNNSLEIPIDGFNDKVFIPDVQSKNQQQIFQLGAYYAGKISVQQAGVIGQNLLMNLTKTEPQGQTAMTPALTFCFGLASKLKNFLHQIVVVTDGESNIGFGPTQADLSKQELENSKNLFEKLALNYAIPLNCMINVITFQDCTISFDIIDRMMMLTSGLPCQITFLQKNGQKIVTEESVESIQLEMAQNFLEFPKQLCFNSKILIACDRKQIKFRCAENMKHFTSEDPDTGALIIKTGIKSIGEQFKVQFYIPPQIEQFMGTVKFTIINEFERKNKKTTSVRTQVITVNKGNEEKANKQQIIVMNNEIREKLGKREFFEQNLEEYGELDEKIENNKNVKEGINSQLLQKFRMKKKILEETDKSISKLQKEKMSMRSRKSKTYKPMEDDSDEGEEDDFFK